MYNPLSSSPPKPEDFYQGAASALPDCIGLCFFKPNDAPLVPTKFGLFPKGSFLSYQQKFSGHVVMNLYDDAVFPDLPCRDVMRNNFDMQSLGDSERQKLKSLSMSPEESIHFETITRLQSEDKVWFKTRENRITASNLGQIVKRKKADVSKLVEKLQSTRHVQTEAMKLGLANEPIAAVRYCELKENKVNIYPCGCVVNCFAPWLAASPDRKVYDPSRRDPFGLLEIKCPVSIETVSKHECLEETEEGKLQLKRNHNFFYQVLCQLAVTGLPWCDFFIWCSGDKSFHCETIHFEEFEEMWNTAKDRVDKFYFEHFLN